MQRTELQSLLERAKSIYAWLDKATAATEIRADELDEHQVLGRDLITQQLAERKKKLAEKNA